MVLDAISNGLGSQSLYLMLLAATGKLNSRVSITADTGAETDCVWSTGERSTAREYWQTVVKPFADKYGIDARFVRAQTKDKTDMVTLWDHTVASVNAGRLNHLKMPLYGSRGGQMGQSCTGRWKIAAIKQEARRMGAKKLITAQGIHAAEAGRRVKGIPKGFHGAYKIYQDTIVKKDENRQKYEVEVRWCQHYYPLVDLGMGRNDSRRALEAEGIPYLLSSECDCCPHKDLTRWERTSPDKLVEIAGVEARMGGKFFFTDERVPLMEALAIKRAKPAATLEPSFGCEGSVCGI